MKRKASKPEAPEKKQGASEKLHAASFSIFVNAFLIAVKLVVAIITGSIAILAEFFHSLFDMLASVLAYLGIKKADQPADRDHMFGHEKFENISSFAQTVLIAVTSILIIYEALGRLAAPKIPEALGLGLAVMILTVAIDWLISRYLHSMSRKHGSPALEADAYHFTTDLWSSLAVIVGLIFVLLGFQIFDSLAAMVVAILMLWISYKLGKKSIHVLMDMSPPESTVRKIEEITGSTRGVRHFHGLRVRQAGNRLLVEIHIHLPAKMTISEGHRIAHFLKEKLMKEIPEIKDVTVHTEPAKRKGRLA